MTAKMSEAVRDAERSDADRRKYFERFGDWPPETRWDGFDKHMAKVRKALETGKPIPEPDIPDDMLI